MPGQTMADFMHDSDITKNYHGGNELSAEAESSTPRSVREKQRNLILQHVTACGENGSTCDEAEIVLAMPHQTCSARCSELKRDGLVVESGKTRPTRQGKKAAVLTLPGVKV